MLGICTLRCEVCSPHHALLFKLYKSQTFMPCQASVIVAWRKVFILFPYVGSFLHCSSPFSTGEVLSPVGFFFISALTLKNPQRTKQNKIARMAVKSTPMHSKKLICCNIMSLILVVYILVRFAAWMNSLSQGKSRLTISLTFATAWWTHEELRAISQPMSVVEYSGWRYNAHITMCLAIAVLESLLRLIIASGSTWR